MVKNKQKSIGKSKTPFKAYYNVIGSACGCSSKYAKLILEGRTLGRYKDKVYTERDTELTRKIKQKAKELEKFLNPDQ